MNQTIKKLLTFKMLFNHIVVAVFCSSVFFELNLLIDFYHRWYVNLIYGWLILLLIHFVLFLVNLKKK